MPAASVDEAISRPRERSAFTIPEFCWRNDISTGTYHKLKNAGLGPKEMRANNVVRISAEAELEWQRKLSKPNKAKSGAEARAKERGRKAGKLSAASPNHASKRNRSVAA